MELLLPHPQLPPATLALGGLGCVIILPYYHQVYWNSAAALLHGEEPNINHSFSLAQFVQWYAPEQREHFVQSLFSAQNSFQLSLTIAFSKQSIRYQLSPLWPLQAQSKIPAMRAWVGLLRLL